MYALWQGLLANFALVAMTILLWTNIRGAFERFGDVAARIAFGLVMGAGSVLAMCLSFQIRPGFISDLRSAPIAVAGLFGGPWVGALSAALALIYRGWLGGMGAVPGCATIITTALTAALLDKRFVAPSAKLYRMAAISTLVAALGSVAGWSLMPHFFEMPDMVRAAFPLMIMNSLGIYLGSLALRQEEQRRTLGAANALYRAIIYALPDCLNVKDSQGRFVVANPATAQLMGAASVEDLIGKSDFDCYPEATARRFRDEEQAVLADAKGAKTFEQQALFRDGGVAWLSTLKAPFYDESGQFAGLITHNRNITEAKRLQLLLDETQRQLSDALANMADGLVVYDDRGRIVLCNEQYRSLFPVTADLRIVGADLPDIIREAVKRGEERLAEGADVEDLISKILRYLKQGGDRPIGLADGRWLEARTRPTANGGALTVYADVTSRKRMERELQFRAEHDSLTGLANRAMFLERLEQSFERSRHTQTEILLIAIDLDHFKRINDSFGHQFGDEVLIEIAARLRATCWPGDLVARLGGDEFAILCEGADLKAKQAEIARRVVETVSARLRLRGESFQPSCSVGTAICPDDADGSEALIACADAALYAAKGSGRSTWVVYRDAPDGLRAAS